MKRLFSISILSLGATALMAIACSSGGSGSNNSGEDPDGERDKTGDKGTDKPNPQNPPNTKDAGGGGVDSGGGDPNVTDCAKTTGQEACAACCDKQNNNGASVANAALAECACNTPGACQAACGGNWCAGKESTDDCAKCVGEQADCQDKATQACVNDENCLGFALCANTADCAGKPQ